MIFYWKTILEKITSKLKVIKKMLAIIRSYKGNGGPEKSKKGVLKR